MSDATQSAWFSQNDKEHCKRHHDRNHVKPFRMSNATARIDHLLTHPIQVNGHESLRELLGEQSSDVCKLLF